MAASKTSVSTPSRRLSSSSASEPELEDSELKLDDAALALSDSSTPRESSDNPILILSRGSSSNDKFDCDALGIHYELSTPQSVFNPRRLSTISRWDPKLDKYTPVAEWERNTFKTDLIKMSALSMDDYVPMNDVFPRTWGIPYDAYFNRSFTSPDGKQYVWKSRPTTMKLYRSEDDSEKLIAIYRRGRRLVKSRKPSIELYDGYEGILDIIVVTCIISVKRRKEGERRRAASASGGG